MIRPLSGIKLLLATSAVSIGTLLISLDQFIVNVAIPTISGELGVSVDDGTWVVTSYLIANAISVPLTGWLASRYGRVRLFSVSAILFALISGLCGLSTSFSMLLLFRIFQGLVSGSLVPLSQTLLLMLFPGKRGFAMGMWGLVVMVGPALGPVVGGALIDKYNWSWLFYINLPLGILSGIIAYFLLIPFETKIEKRSIDVVGILLLVITVAAYQVVLDRGNDADWWSSSFIVTLTVIAIIGLCFFLVWEGFHTHPVVDLSFFKQRNFTLGTLTIAISMLIVFGSLIVEPNWAQAQLGYTPLWAGYSIAPFGITALFIFPLVGAYVHKMDNRLWIAVGFLFMIPSFFYMSHLHMGTPFFNLAWPHALQGIGFALFYVPLSTISLEKIPHERMANAASLFSFVRLLFLGAGITINTTYFSRRENFFQSRYTESVIPSNPQWETYLQALDQNLGISGEHANAFIYQTVLNQAYTETFLEMSYLWAWGFVFLFIMLFFFKSTKQTSL